MRFVLTFITIGLFAVAAHPETDIYIDSAQSKILEATVETPIRTGHSPLEQQTGLAEVGSQWVVVNSVAGTWNWLVGFEYWVKLVPYDPGEKINLSDVKGWAFWQDGSSINNFNMIGELTP